MFDDVVQFHTKFGINYQGKPRVLPQGEQGNRLRFLNEELEEYRMAMLLCTRELEADDLDKAEFNHNLAECLDALVDLVYVAMGTAHLHGFDFNEAWRRVHAANMLKTRGEGWKKVIKPPGWEPPNHVDLIEDHAHGS